MTTRLDKSRPAACVFDAYGTIFDFGSAVRRRAEAVGDRAATLIETWRAKQLQYTWLRSLGREYVDFDQVTGEALDYALEAVQIRNSALRGELLAAYRTLDAYPDAVRALTALRAAGLPCWILSNGTPAMLAAAVRAARLEVLLDGVLSVESVRVYKPDPRVYQLAVDALGLAAGRIAFVSANGWDAAAGAAFGFATVWCNRTAQPRERLPGELAHELGSLDGLTDALGLGAPPRSAPGRSTP